MPSRDLCTLLRKSPNVHAVFGRKTLNFCTRIYVPLPCLLRMCVFLLMAENVGSLETQASKTKNKKLKYRTKKERKNPFVQRLSRGKLNACAKFQGLPLKNDVNFGL